MFRHSLVSMALEAYVYDPLPTPTSVRLLELLDSSESGSGQAVDSCSHGRATLTCSLKIADLEDAPNYDVLSYTWGNPLTIFPSKDAMLEADKDSKRQFHIVCNGRTLAVGHNLFDALPYLTNISGSLEKVGGQPGQEKSSLIWIDAICIDQTNLSERSAQVSIMDKIYRQAAVVFIWLGEEDAFREDALGACQTLARIGCVYNNELAALSKESIVGDFYRTLGVPSISARQWIALYAFLQRAWFRRAWVVQEVGLATLPIVMCGSIAFGWRSVSKVAFILFETRWAQQLSLLACRAMGHEYVNKMWDYNGIETKYEKPHQSRGPPVLHHSLNGFGTFHSIVSPPSTA